MSDPIAPHLTTGTPARWLALIALTPVLALWAFGPIAQWASYHQFADTGPAWGLPHAANVLSNLPFALIGLWACWKLRTRAHSCDSPAPRPLAWRLFAAAIACTAVGSALYHWHPDNARLVFDRLPIAWACVSLLCAFLSERLHAGWGRLPVLGTAWFIASMSVAAWGFGQRHGAGDLRAYLWVQFLPMLMVPAALLMKLPALTPRAVPATTWWAVLVVYAAAKLAEMADGPLLDHLGWISGHTLKHLLAAWAAAALLNAAIAHRSRR